MDETMDETQWNQRKLGESDMGAPKDGLLEQHIDEDHDYELPSS